MRSLGTAGARALLLLSAAADAGPLTSEQLLPLVRTAGERLGSAVASAGIGHRVASGADAYDAYDAVLEEGLSNGVRLGGFDAVVELELRDLPDGPASSELFRDAGDLLGSSVDRSRSTVALGQVATIIDGAGPLRLVYCMRRLPGVSHQEFSDFWLHQHATVAQFTAHICGYFQLHVDIERSRAAAAGAGLPLDEIDGVALESFEDVDRFVQCVRPAPSFAQRARSSEEHVNDLGRVTALLTAVDRVDGG